MCALRVTAGQLTLDTTTGKILCRGRTVCLTPSERRLLTVMMQHLGKVVSRGAIEQHVWDCNHPSTPNATEQLVLRVRRALRNVPCGLEMRTVRGLGYVLEESHEAFDDHVPAHCSRRLARHDDPDCSHAIRMPPRRGVFRWHYIEIEASRIAEAARIENGSLVLDLVSRLPHYVNRYASDYSLRILDMNGEVLFATNKALLERITPSRIPTPGLTFWLGQLDRGTRSILPAGRLRRSTTAVFWLRWQHWAIRLSSECAC